MLYMLGYAVYIRAYLSPFYNLVLNLSKMGSISS